MVLLDGRTIKSTHVTELDVPDLPLAARTAHIFPGLTNGSLISIGQLCDHGCIATFTSDAVTITLDKKVILRGDRSAPNRLWTLHAPSSTPPTKPLPSPIFPVANNVKHSSLLADRIAFLHASLFSPQLSTWSVAFSATDSIVDNLDENPVPDDPPALKSNFLYADCYETTGKIFSDLTGRFVTSSSTGNAYMLVVYDYDSNFIHVEPMKNRTGTEILAAYRRAFDLFSSRGLRPQLQRLDNEASTALQQFMDDSRVDFQLVPPHLHRRNVAERAIRTFKNHFIAGLCSTDKDFPLHLWDRLLPQAIMTLNLLRGSQINPRLSAWAQVHGAFDFNRTPLAPPGVKVLVHEKPTVRKSWSPHAVDGWYIGPAMHHYRCYRVWINSTTSERIADTLTWFPSKVQMPTTSSRDTVVAAARNLATALSNPTPASPLAPLATQERVALQQLSTIFSNFSDPTSPPAAISPPCCRATASPIQGFAHRATSEGATKVHRPSQFPITSEGARFCSRDGNIQVSHL
ncbi:predicted protein [Phaeodactylum tricornutum CCAP 1055/1]|uniref:Integrase catalytic domain-containing protein n=1 Tax=Phaeodactylum tricornutum (strain CCAP 1055/1) TaxID=556484 RepID=B7FRL1_PHATC|nr:predicted protein [Phaeodactylum tricornutum CCAP 1055/1]EEC51526.1 predicted protein [Phaeodactylum tricornutum CCAP 1055/1]|eukprot:XP_002177063.1 predicted protein [Phaeodactylum tricornutum CCAP 1055/1]